TGNRGRESHRLGLVRRSLLRTKRDRRASISIVQNRRDAGTSPSDAPPELLRELVAHLRQNRTQLREEWVGRIAETRLLTAMTKEEIFAEATSVYEAMWRRWKPKHSRRCKIMRETSRNGSFLA